MGGLLIIYTMSGGAKAVAYTQKLQMMIMIICNFIAGYMVVNLFRLVLGLQDALRKAGKSGKMNVITNGYDDNGFDWKDKYNIWSGLIGGFFLSAVLFWNRSKPGRTGILPQRIIQKADRVADERAW